MWPCTCFGHLLWPSSGRCSWRIYYIECQSKFTNIKCWVLNRSLISMLKYKIVCAELHIDMLHVWWHHPSAGGDCLCWLCWVQHSITSRHNTTTTTSAWMVSTYTQHINMQLSTNNFSNSLYFNVDIKLLFKTEHFIFAN